MGTFDTGARIETIGVGTSEFLLTVRTGYFLHILTASLTLVLWLVALLLVWTLHRQWWRVRGVRRALWMAPTINLVIIAAWWLVVNNGWNSLAWPLRFLAATGTIISLGMVITLPFTGVVLTAERAVRWVARKLRERSGPGTENASARPVDVGRREALSIVAGGLPVAFGAAGLAGAINSSTARVHFPEVSLSWAGLPRDLDGLRILHLSDIHLGYAHDLADMEEIISDASAQRVDLVLVTGDIADDVTMLPEALRMIDSLRPRLGAFATLGNHEYYAGIDSVLRSMDKGPIPLLREAGTNLAVGGATLHLLGIDDPTRISRAINPPNSPAFLLRGIERAMDGGPSDAFRILMSHRPKGFDPAAQLGIDLTLAGHTHGGIQLGIGGRSVLERFFPEQYFWGHYSKGKSQLYTSAGVGHWFPFRLGCPMEAPIYTLKRLG